ncbi:MAG: PIN domain-containing protein [Candidatus Gracilibacteria bacterium]
MAFVFVDTSSFLSYLLDPLFNQNIDLFVRNLGRKNVNKDNLLRVFFAPLVERFEKLRISVYKRALNLLLPEVIVSEIYRKVGDKLLDFSREVGKILDSGTQVKKGEYFQTKKAILALIEKQGDNCKKYLEEIFIHPTVFALDWTEQADKNARKRVANKVPPFSTNPKKQRADRINDCIAFESILECLHDIFVERKEGEKKDCKVFVVTQDSDYGCNGELYPEIQRDLRQYAVDLEYRTGFNELLDFLTKTDANPCEDHNFCRTCRIHEKPYLAVFSPDKFQCSACGKIFMEHKDNLLYGTGLVCPFCGYLTLYSKLKIV